MAFLEDPRFPVKISDGSSGGPRWMTEIAISASGYEQRIAKWAESRHEYNAAVGVRDMEDLELLKEFFMNMKGSAEGFRWKDHADYKSCALEDAPDAIDQPLGTGDDVQTQFQLIKRYTAGAWTYDRPIVKPVTGTVLIAFDLIMQPTGWSVDTTTGVVTFDTPPTGGVAISAGYEFDVPCRFGSDVLSAQLGTYLSGSAQVPIIEVRIA